MNKKDTHASSGRERRAHPRATCDWPLTIQLQDGAHPARLRDISRAGLCFFIDRPIPEMTVLSLDIVFPGSGGPGPGRIEARGVVVRCQRIARLFDHYEVAVFLNELGEAQRESLDAFVAGVPAS